MTRALLAVLLLVWPAATAHAQSTDIVSLERAAGANPSDVRGLERLADAYVAAGRPVDAIPHLVQAATLAPRNPQVLYALGQGYNAVKQEALASFRDPAEAPWRQLLSADALLSSGHLTDAFVLYRESLAALPSMSTIHESIARIYDRTGHRAWAIDERARGRLNHAGCSTRLALCEFAGGRFRSSLDAALKASDPESRYWRARAANELALAAFARLDGLPDSPERRLVRAAAARAQERPLDAVVELKEAVRLAPKQPELVYQLASAYFAARDFDATLLTLAPLLRAYPDDPRLLTLQGQSLLQLRRADEALPILQRLVERTRNDPAARIALGRAYFQTGNMAAAVPFFEERLASDEDGSVHVQLARAYSALGQPDKAAPLLTRSEELRRASEERRATAVRRTITGPK